MARGFPRPVDGSIPIQALLYNDEESLASQDGVGIYYDSQKSPQHQNGTIHVTTHRLFYIDAQRMAANSFQMDLSLITQTEYYAGLFKSSPKVTCHLSGDPAASDPTERETGFESWECEVCGNRNPPGLSPAAARICSLCGVPRTSIPSPTTSVLSQHLSSSLPSSSSASLTATPHNDPKQQTSIACPACTFLNHPSLRSCEICSTELPQLKREYTKSAPSSRSITPGFDDIDPSSKKMIKISFRKGGDKPFYAVLKRSLKSKAWEETGAGLALTHDVDRSGSDVPHAIGIGIDGILRTVESSAQGRETRMKDNLQDLEALRVKAKDMVKLAAELNEKLKAAASTSRSSWNNNSEPEEATFILSSLSQLGLQMSNTPVTLDMMKDERNWFEELARELAGVLQGTTKAIMKERGIIALDEVWGSWNRARGVALIPPSTFLQVIPLLPVYTEPVIQHRAFSSGLNVLHTPPYAQAAFSARISSYLVLGGPRTTMEIAAEENLTVSLVTEMMEAVEVDGAICRDTAITGGGGGSGTIRWWGNLFVDYIWDGPE